MLQAQTNDFLSGKVNAVKNLGGMEALYTKHLKLFIINYHDSFLRLSRHLTFMEYDEAGRLAHSIRGLAATLGMPELEFQCHSLETAINEGRYLELSPILQDYHSALNNVIDSYNFQSSSFVGA